MLITAKIFEDKGGWLAQCESFCLMTQGSSKNDALSMLSDAVQSLYPNFNHQVTWINEKEGLAAVESESIAEALGIMIERNRNDSDLTLNEFANLVGSRNHNSIYAYERATREASFTKIEELMKALGKKLVITLAS
ncbi:MAG: helix-turn-helix transcriptional regulator [Oligoflexus sp.]|nr:helix-turn-helix transcriptional regulator [Oligoflexus sp.]